MQEFNNEGLNLKILSEEMGEVAQIALAAMQVESKISRFGLEDCHPDMPGVTNRSRLEQEIGHMIAMVQILLDNGTVTLEGIDAGVRHKLEKLPRWYVRTDTEVPTGDNLKREIRSFIAFHAPHGAACLWQTGEQCNCWKSDILKRLDTA